LRSILDVVDGGAESPQESRLRLVLVRCGLPKPQTQIAFPDLHIRVDLGWPKWKVAVEYDGVQHWHDSRQRAWDIERIALLEASGWVVVRVSAAMLTHPEVVVDRVRTKLRAAGCPI
jgi:very-short-patch-repair endonuclease